MVARTFGPTTWDVEAGGLLESRGLGPTSAAQQEPTSGKNEKTLAPSQNLVDRAQAFVALQGLLVILIVQPEASTNALDWRPAN